MFFAPAAALLGIGVLMNPAAAHCVTPAGTREPRPDPGLAHRDHRERRDLHPEPSAAHPRGHDHRHRQRHRRRRRTARNQDRAHGRAHRVHAADAHQHRRLPRVGELSQRRQRLRPRQPRPVPDAPPIRLGNRRRTHGPHLPSPRVLRRTDRPELPLTTRPARHPRLAADGPRLRRPSRRGLRLPRPLPQLRTRRREHPHRPHQQPAGLGSEQAARQWRRRGWCSHCRKAPGC